MSSPHLLSDGFPVDQGEVIRAEEFAGAKRERRAGPQAGVTPVSPVPVVPSAMPWPHLASEAATGDAA